MIKDNYAYNSIPGTQNTSEIRVLNFPMSNYEYYELLIDDYYDKPINIIRAGYYNRVKEKGKYTLLENTAYQTSQQKDETVIKIPLNGKYADRITFEIAAPRYYLRHARLYTKATTKYKKKVRTHEYTVKHVHLVSNSGNSFAIDNINADTLFVNIKNLDDAPLEIGKINLYQLNKYLLAELNGGEYYLMYGNKKATKPNYDIKYFTDSIPRHVQTIGTKPAQYIAKPAHVTESNNFNMSTVWLWIIILSVAALLFYMSVKMINDNKKNSR